MSRQPWSPAGHAKARGTVKLRDGRLGILVYWPVPVSARRPGDGPRRGAKAAVQLATGRYISVAPGDVLFPASIGPTEPLPTGPAAERPSAGREDRAAARRAIEEH